MIRVYIQYISVVQYDGNDQSWRVAFPSKGHKLSVLRNGIEDEGLNGTDIVLEVSPRSNANPAAPPGPAAITPIGGRVLKLSEVTKETSYLRKNKDLLKNPFGVFKSRARTVLQLQRGNFSSCDPATTNKYADATWTFGTEAGAHAQQLTDTVVWEIEYTGDYTYTVVVEGKPKARLVDNETLTFMNLDTDKKDFPKKGEQVEMKDVEWLYDLVEPEPARKPRGRAGVMEMAPALTLTPAIAKDVELGMLSGGDLPLCPVGEP
jgi:hypothetical protein